VARNLKNDAPWGADRFGSGLSRGANRVMEIVQESEKAMFHETNSRQNV